MGPDRSFWSVWLCLIPPTGSFCSVCSQWSIMIDYCFWLMIDSECLNLKDDRFWLIASDWLFLIGWFGLMIDSDDDWFWLVHWFWLMNDRCLLMRCSDWSIRIDWLILIGCFWLIDSDWWLNLTYRFSLMDWLWLVDPHWL